MKDCGDTATAERMPNIKHMSEEEGEAMPINQLHENLTGNQAVRAA